MATLEQWKQTTAATRNVRLRSTPTADDPRAVVEQCETCPNKFLRWKGRRRHYCPECAEQRMLKAIVATASKTGPQYEAMVTRQLGYWLGEARRLGLTE